LRIIYNKKKNNSLLIFSMFINETSKARGAMKRRSVSLFLDFFIKDKASQNSISSHSIDIQKQ